VNSWEYLRATSSTADREAPSSEWMRAMKTVSSTFSKSLSDSDEISLTSGRSTLLTQLVMLHRIISYNTVIGSDCQGLALTWMLYEDLDSSQCCSLL
jgi:hypothetical protein